MFFNYSFSTSPQPTDKQSSHLSTYANNCNISEHHSSKNQLTGHTFQCSQSEPNGFSCASNTEPQKLPSTHSSDTLISSKTTVVQPTDEKNTASSSLGLISTEKPSHKGSNQGIATDLHPKTKPIISENSEIQAGILALESLLKINSKLKNKDIATKSIDKPNVSEKIANRNSKWEEDEKLGAQATLGPVLYANICLNLKETYPGNVVIIGAVSIISLLN